MRQPRSSDAAATTDHPAEVSLQLPTVPVDFPHTRLRFARKLQPQSPITLVWSPQVQVQVQVQVPAFTPSELPGHHCTGKRMPLSWSENQRRTSHILRVTHADKITHESHFNAVGLVTAIAALEPLDTV